MDLTPCTTRAMATATEFGCSPDQVDTMSYRELQKLCKRNNIKANSKADVLRASLRNLMAKNKKNKTSEDVVAKVAKKSGICIDLEVVDNVVETEELAGAAVKDITATLAQVEISSEVSAAETECERAASAAGTECERAATPSRTFGTELTTPTKSFNNTLTTKDILSASKSFTMTPTGKIKCSYTGHEMPATAEAVSTYLSGKKYRKAQVKADFEIDEFKPWIVETNSAENPDQVWCTVTNKFVSRDATIIRRHMTGKKFTKMLAKLQNFQKLRGVPTPKGKRTVFNSPKNTPRSDPYSYNVHWSMEDYADTGRYM